MEIPKKCGKGYKMMIALSVLSWPDLIPKNIYITTKYSNSKASKDYEYESSITNPDFKVVVHDDASCVKAMNQTELGSKVIPIFTSTYKEIKADLWRSYIMYTKGGVYADVDTRFNAKLESFVPSSSSFLTSNSLYQTRLNPILIVSEPGLPIWKHTLQRTLQAYNRGHRHFWDLSVCVHLAESYKTLTGCNSTGLVTKKCDDKLYVLAQETKLHKKTSTVLENKTIMNNHVRDPHH